MAMFEILQVTWEVFLCAVNVVTFIHYSNACHPESESPTKNSFRKESIFLLLKGNVNSTSFINMIIVRKTQYAFYAIFYFLSIILTRRRTFFLYPKYSAPEGENRFCRLLARYFSISVKPRYFICIENWNVDKKNYICFYSK